MFNLFKKLLYLVTVVMVIVLAWTGFYPSLTGTQLSGYALMLHATAAPVFAVCFMLVAILWADRCQFTVADWQNISNFGRRNDAKYAGSSCCTIIRKVCFWLMVALAIPVILTIALSMFPIFGTHGQEVLYVGHKCTTFTFMVCAVIFFVLSLKSGKCEASCKK